MKIFNNTKRRAVSAIAELLLVIIIIIIIIELQEAQLSLFRTVSEIFRVNNGVTLIWIRGHSRSLQMAPFSRSHTSSYWRSIVTMAPSCTSSEIKWGIGRNRDFFLTSPAFNALVRGSQSEYCLKFGMENQNNVRLVDGEKSSKIHLAVSTQHRRVTDGRTDGQTDGHLATA